MTDTVAGIDDDVARLVRRYETPTRVADVLCDRHARGGREALLYDAPSGARSVSFEQLTNQSRNLAAALAEQGVGRGDRVAVLLPRSPELVAALLAIWRLGGVHVPLFTAFGPDAVTYRVEHSGAGAILTDTDNRAKVERSTGQEPAVFCLGAGRTGDLDLTRAIETPGAADDCVLDPGDPFILLYTSGTTGRPKGVPVPVRALASFHAYLTYAIDLRPSDVFWNVSDPGWAYGLWYGLIGPLLLGHSTILRAGAFDPADALAVIERHRVTNLAGSPTFYRALRLHGVDPGFTQRTGLRAASSAGEPLSPELLDWSAEHLGTPIHDHYGQSEVGMVVGFARRPGPAGPPRPGLMGRAMPGFRAVILDAGGRPAQAGTPGELALDTTTSPLYWFDGYYRAPDKTAERFPYGPRYYVTGDTAELRPDGTFGSATRADDVITSSGYRIGPYDVEIALHAHHAVAQAAVFGTPDELRGEAVTAAIVLTDRSAAGDELVVELQHHVRTRLGKHLYPRRIMFVDELPSTPSGKIQRRVLRDRWRSSPDGPSS
jgi:acetyl-CoA synthetase